MGLAAEHNIYIYISAVLLPQVRLYMNMIHTIQFRHITRSIYCCEQKTYTEDIALRQFLPKYVVEIIHISYFDEKSECRCEIWLSDICGRCSWVSDLIRCLHLQTSHNPKETPILLGLFNASRWRLYDLSKRREQQAQIHGVIFQMTSILGKISGCTRIGTHVQMLTAPNPPEKRSNCKIL